MKKYKLIDRLVYFLKQKRLIVKDSFIFSELQRVFYIQRVAARVLGSEDRIERIYLLERQSEESDQCCE